jgi:hypothetical protein
MATLCGLIHCRCNAVQELLSLQPYAAFPLFKNGVGTKEVSDMAFASTGRHLPHVGAP